MAIIIIAGGIGSGKSLTAVKEIVTRDTISYSNFGLYGVDVKRLKYSHLFRDVKVDIGNMKFKIKRIINYDYWNGVIKEYKGFDIVLDEFHNLMSSRRAMSKRNVLLSDWLSQIRKILGASEQNNLYLVTQKIRRIDINSRDLAHCFIVCRKQEFREKIPTKVRESGRLSTRMLPIVVIIKYWFGSEKAVNDFEDFGRKTYYNITKFVANHYYRYYDSYELIDFGSEDYI